MDKWRLTQEQTTVSLSPKSDKPANPDDKYGQEPKKRRNKHDKGLSCLCDAPDKPSRAGYWWAMPKDYRGPGPLAYFLGAKVAGETPLRVPPSLVPLWARLGYVRKKGVKNAARQANRWDSILRRHSLLRRWVYSDNGLRAPRRWPSAIEDLFWDLDIRVTPVAFAAACFAGKNRLAQSYTKWRGMPELTAAAHGWDLQPEEQREALHAVRALSVHVPFLVYALRPDFTNVPLPRTSDGLIARLAARQQLLVDPMGQRPSLVSRAIDTEIWSPAMVKALPRLTWRPCTKNVPEERSLVEAGAGGWRPLASPLP